MFDCLSSFYYDFIMCLRGETGAGSRHCCSLHPSLLFDAAVVVAFPSLIVAAVVEVVDEILLLWTEVVLS